jgi:hypothetical protein
MRKHTILNSVCEMCHTKNVQKPLKMSSKRSVQRMTLKPNLCATTLQLHCGLHAPSLLPPCASTPLCPHCYCPITVTVTEKSSKSSKGCSYWPQNPVGPRTINELNAQHWSICFAGSKMHDFLLFCCQHKMSQISCFYFCCWTMFTLLAFPATLAGCMHACYTFLYIKDLRNFCVDLFGTPLQLFSLKKRNRVST